MTPLEAAKILSFSQNRYDFRRQHPKNIKKSLGPLFFVGGPPLFYVSPTNSFIILFWRSTKNVVDSHTYINRGQENQQNVTLRE